MAERPALDAVLLDAGGTLVRLDFEWMAETLASLGLDASTEAVRRGEIEGRRRYDASRGAPASGGGPPAPLGASGDTRAYFAGTIESVGAGSTVTQEALRRFFERHQAEGLWTRPMEGARGALDGLAALGLRLGVVSNSDGRAETHLSDCGVRDGLEFVIDSHRVGVEKPDPAIFRVALERLGVPASRALFVGDIRSVDERGAAAAGLHFVLLDPYGDYAPAGTPAVPSIAELPAFVSSRFVTPLPRGTSRARDGAPVTRATHRGGT